MANKMLIDASHPEETRVVVLRGNRVEEFDFEAASKKQLRGNIYLAKVTRVEPSLQAAFVEYGGNRHGFLAFAEIHPDYYQIPVADRQALLEEEARAHSDEDDDERREQRHSRRNRRNDSEQAEKRSAGGDAVISEAAPDVDGGTIADVPQSLSESPPDHEVDGPKHDTQLHEVSHDPGAVTPAQQPGDSDHAHDEPAITTFGGDGEGVDVPAHESEGEGHNGRDNSHRGRGRRDRNRRSGGRGRDSEAKSEEVEADTEGDQIEQMGGDAMEELPYRAPRMRRQYKIQEVIKRRQVLLIQVVKEERGNKGAALTTYLSLAGRYSVLMPNTARGGGISRKITDTGDRKRLKEIVQDLEVPEGMGIILRTAGAARTKPEVKRDFEYLLRMWETVRELTLKSSAPMLVYEEGSLIKRAIRDLYNKDIDEVIVAGDEGYREAKEFMRLLMPSHAKNVRAYKELQPIFAKAGAEAQLDAMFSSQVTLKSGGYIVINQTEALVAIDVNSGRSTREHNIEDTAVRTNLEAADEVARQLRLRDLAGLIVVDFIDMDENRNNRSVERRMKDALANDRARIQVGRISHFGLLEMSRQRIRTGVLEGSTVPCPHCAGVGMVRSKSSLALHVMRVIEDALIKNSSYNLILRTRTEVALYVLNQKRAHLRELETRFGVNLTIAADETLTGAVYHALERGDQILLADGTPRPEIVRIEPTPLTEIEEPEVEEAFEEVAEVEPPRQPRPHDRDRPQEGGRREDNGRREASSERPQRGPERANGERPAEDNEQSRRRKRRRRRRDGGDRENIQNFAPGAEQPGDGGLEALAQANGDRMSSGGMPHAASAPDALPETVAATPSAGDVSEPVVADAGEAKPRRSRRGKPKSDGALAKTKAAPVKTVPAEDGEADKPAKRPRRASKARKVTVSEETVSAPSAAPAKITEVAPEPKVVTASAPVQMTEAPVASRPDPIPEAQAGPKRSGWWQRVKGAVGGN